MACPTPDKLVFKTKGDAKKWLKINAFKFKDAGKRYLYCCAGCNKWHITSNRPSIKSRDLMNVNKLKYANQFKAFLA